ncbi:hypothetical protein [Corynebacterium halotolerans]|uniref:hypothetical protein n=1 Tax=Corynebacterium halotolerans TaxID=225326 RepID=UPI003CF390A1
MNFDAHFTIDLIRNLSGDHPEEVVTLLEAYEQLLSFDHQPPSLANLSNPEHTHRVMEELVRFNATTGEATAKAKETGANSIRGKLTHAVRNNLDHYLGFQRTVFEQAAKKYTAAVAKLPDEFTNEDVLNFTPTEFKALQDVRAAVFDLKDSRGWSVNLPNLIQGIRYDSKTWNLNHLILASSDAQSWNAVQYTPDFKEADAAFVSIAPEIRYALEHGAEFELSTPEEATQRNREASTSWVQ